MASPYPSLPSSPLASLLAAAAALLGTSAGALRAQTPCGLQWQPGAGTFGPNGNARALAELPNGDLIAAGSFRIADGAQCANIARFDGTTWQRMGDGFNSFVSALAVRPNGELYACGGFSSSGTAFVGRAARWDGTAWANIGADVVGSIFELAIAPNGDLIAAGSFESISGVPAENLARFDGASWSAFAPPSGLRFLNTIEFLPNGNLAAGGTGPLGQPDLVVWDGATWSGLNGVSSSALVSIRDIAARPNGDIAILTQAFSAANTLTIWDGTGLTTINTQLLGIDAIETAANGDVLIAGVANAAGAAEVYRFDGTNLTALGDTAATSATSVLELANGDILAGGNPSSAGSVSRFDGQWTSLGQASSAPSDVRVVERLRDGRVVAGGDFTQIFGTQANNLAVFDGTTWQAFGAGTNGPVTSLKATADGALLVGGDFTQIDGIAALRVARLDSGAWSPLGAGLPVAPEHLSQNSMGAVAAVLGAGNTFTNRVQRFDGTTWINVSPAPAGAIRDVVALDSDDFAILGNILIGVVQFAGAVTFDSNAQIQTVMPGTDNRVLGRAERDANGELIAVSVGGIPATTEFVRLSSGTAIVQSTAPGSTAGTTITILADGDIIAAGPVANVPGSPARRIGRWDGSTWSTIDGDLGDGTIADLAVAANGDLIACGTFETAGTLASQQLARASSSCAADVQLFGLPCTGSNGQVDLTAGTSLPWIGSTLQATASGMAPISLAVQTVGSSTTTQALPLGFGSCFLLVQPFATALLTPANGQVDVPLPIPDMAALIGQQFAMQLIGVELDPALNLIGTTGSNALVLTIGAL
ncbi:MAG: hypothetical protein AB8H80_15865 [Planctomycetota bacterium]